MQTGTKIYERTPTALSFSKSRSSARLLTRTTRKQGERRREGAVSVRGELGDGSTNEPTRRQDAIDGIDA